ncbi:MAG: hypothetical protein JO040_06705 [Gemmatimonadetes bacterium]|nr:hypothetical protein [Gemmatimonadota bacterium]
MNRKPTTPFAALLLALAVSTVACSGDPAGSGGGTDEETPVGISPPCLIGPSQVAGSGNLPVLGIGCVAERYTSELWVQGKWAYTGGWSRRGGIAGNVLKVWSVSGNSPLLVDSVVIADATTLGDVQASDDGKLLVVATEPRPTGSIVVYDLADPAHPRQLSRYTTPNTANGVHTAQLSRVNGKLYGFLSIDPAGSSPARLVIVDLSDPAAPREVWTQVMGRPYVHDVFVRDGLLFTAVWNDGTIVWDIGGGGRGGSPQNPVQMVQFQTQGGQVHNLWWYQDAATGSKRYLFVGEEGPGSIGTSSEGDIHVVDLGNLTAPKEVAFFHVPNAGTHNFSVDEQSGVLYAAYYNAGVRAIDVRGDLGTCGLAQKEGDRCNLSGRELGRALAGGVPQPYVWGVHFTGGKLYASDMVNGLWKLDVSSLKR